MSTNTSTIPIKPPMKQLFIECYYPKPAPKRIGTFEDSDGKVHEASFVVDWKVDDDKAIDNYDIFLRCIRKAWNCKFNMGALNWRSIHFVLFFKWRVKWVKVNHNTFSESYRDTPASISVGIYGYLLKPPMRLKTIGKQATCDGVCCNVGLHLLLLTNVYYLKDLKGSGKKTKKKSKNNTTDNTTDTAFTDFLDEMRDNATTVNKIVKNINDKTTIFDGKQFSKSNNNLNFNHQQPIYQLSKLLLNNNKNNNNKNNNNKNNNNIKIKSKARTASMVETPFISRINVKKLKSNSNKKNNKKKHKTTVNLADSPPNSNKYTFNNSNQAFQQLNDNQIDKQNDRHMSIDDNSSVTTNFNQNKPLKPKKRKKKLTNLNDPNKYNYQKENKSLTETLELREKQVEYLTIQVNTYQNKSRTLRKKFNDLKLIHKRVSNAGRNEIQYLNKQLVDVQNKYADLKNKYDKQAKDFEDQSNSYLKQIESLEMSNNNNYNDNSSNFINSDKSNQDDIIDIDEDVDGDDIIDIDQDEDENEEEYDDYEHYGDHPDDEEYDPADDNIDDKSASTVMLQNQVSMLLKHQYTSDDSTDDAVVDIDENDI